MGSIQLNKLLTKLGLINVVFFRNKEKNTFDFNFHPDIKNRLKTIQPDAIYVFNKQPFILFFDLTKNNNSILENEIYKRVWSFDSSPIIFIIKNIEIQVFNALNYIKNKTNISGKLEQLNLSEDERNDKFSFWNLQSGDTWNWFQKSYLESTKKKETRKRVNERLFQNIKDVRLYLIDESKPYNLNEEQANSLILRLIFIRYLIDRKIEIDENFIFGETINDKRKSFSELIKQPKRLNELFINLNDKFNGVLFKELDIQLNQSQAIFLANVFRGEVDEKGSLFEGYFFEIFDFSIIPVEVISGIYESLIDDETRKLDSAVYTPSFLVDYVLNDTVENYLNKSLSSECTIFEVAVGSGIFLVQSLRRMIEKEIELNEENDKEIFSNKIREIAKNNLFGIDINREALKVTCFSIYIALLDYQEPKDIKKYPFPNLLDENLFEANFFDTTHKFNEIVRQNKPKFILGNPPWKNGSKDDIHLQYLKNNGLIDTISDYQLAQSFLLRTKDFSQELPICSLIVTSKAFYNNTAINFKKKFLKDFFLFKCLDLSSVRTLIFEKAKNPALVLKYQFANGKNTNNNIVNHLSLKSNVYLKKYRSLVIEKNDIKNILQKYFIENSWMFKIALYGNTLDFNLLNRKKDTLKTYLNKNNIHYGKGIEQGNPKKSFPFLKNLHLIKKENYTNIYTENSKLERISQEEINVKAGRTIDLFENEKIILGKRTRNETYLKFSFSGKNSAFTENFYGITTNKLEIISSIFCLFLSDYYSYYIYLTSANWGVYNPEINLNEYISFPYIAPNKEVEKKFYDIFSNFLKPYKENINAEFKSETLPSNNDFLKKINTLIYDIYNIKDYEKDLIDYVLNVSRYQFQENKQHLFTKKVDSNEEFLEKYANVYIQEFEKIYDDEFIQVEIYPLKHFIALNFVFLDSKPYKPIIYPDKNDEIEILKRLANNLSIELITNTHDVTKNLFIQKDIKGFESNSFYIIKPNEYKCWHRAMAWYDVAEFKEAIQKAELKRLNFNSTND